MIILNVSISKYKRSLATNMKVIKQIRYNLQWDLQCFVWEEQLMTANQWRYWKRIPLFYFPYKSLQISLQVVPYFFYNFLMCGQRSLVFDMFTFNTILNRFILKFLKILVTINSFHLKSLWHITLSLERLTMDPLIYKVSLAAYISY